MSHNKTFNVLHTIVRLPVGGVENMLYKVLSGYHRNRFNPIVCCIKEGGDVADKLINEGFRVEVLGRMKGKRFDIGAVAGIYNLIKNENIHILRTHQYHSNLYGRIAGMLAGVPVIIPSFHNLYESPSTPKLHRKAINHILGRKSDAVVAVSNAVAHDIKKFDNVPAEKIKVIYNGIVLSALQVSTSKHEARKIFNLPQDLTVIGTTGRLTMQKGHRYLIEAIAQLQDCCVAIAGDGPLLDELRAIANKVGTKCIFLGRITPDKVPLFLRATDIFCFPSLWEGFPSALVEAMAAGLPTVAADIPPHREVADDAAIYVPKANSSKLAAALDELINNPSLAVSMATKAGERAKLFSIEETVNAYENLFEEILKKKAFL